MMSVSLHLLWPLHPPQGRALEGCVIRPTKNMCCAAVPMKQEVEKSKPVLSLLANL